MSSPLQLPEAFPKRWVVMGVSGSGKSTVGKMLAGRLGAQYVEGDDYHPRANINKMAAGQPLTDEDRKEWLLRLSERIRQSRQEGTPLVLACSALKRRYRDLLRDADADLAFLHLDGERELIAARMQTRTGHFMPPALLDSQLRDLEPLQADERGCRLDIRDAPQELVERLLRPYQAD
jgi:gluconokinase